MAVLRNAVRAVSSDAAVMVCKVITATAGTGPTGLGRFLAIFYRGRRIIVRATWLPAGLAIGLTVCIAVTPSSGSVMTAALRRAGAGTAEMSSGSGLIPS